MSVTENLTVTSFGGVLNEITGDAPLEAISNYQMKPSLQDSFRTSNVKEIIRDVLQDILKGNTQIFLLNSYRPNIRNLPQANSIHSQMFRRGQRKSPIKSIAVSKIYQCDDINILCK